MKCRLLIWIGILFVVPCLAIAQITSGGPTANSVIVLKKSSSTLTQEERDYLKLMNDFDQHVQAHWRSCIGEFSDSKRFLAELPNRLNALKWVTSIFPNVASVGEQIQCEGKLPLDRRVVCVFPPEDVALLRVIVNRPSSVSKSLLGDWFASVEEQEFFFEYIKPLSLTLPEKTK